ncbi:uncharacterized protein LOC107632907 [Arachis ipaensis]|uniref:uncharacterized protein LOC107632907 n=1 Tax=Arachis ipaensis TaxID=130454 RepID=UPI0007AF074E|nr:uncharacterized protein LOC107632907 [Arachis ipaensis]XP_025638124.1 uncharacterized protein LOC112733396 [Arachis hypogaea]
MSVDGVERSNTLIRGNCEIGSKTLITLFDTVASHSFISFEKASELGLKITMLAYDLEVHTSASETVGTRLGCQQVPFRIKHQTFVHDLICLLMTGLNLILGLDWLSKNHILLDCSERSLQFMSEGPEGLVVAKGYYLNSVVVSCSGSECHGFMLLAASVLGDEQSLSQILVVNEFPEVFPEDIPKVFPLREIKFAIELVPGVGPISIVP